MIIPRTLGSQSNLSSIDPISYPHHDQHDRLWWKWQEESSGKKLDYGGLLSTKPSEAAAIKDTLDMGELAPEVKVLNIIDTREGPLCYTY